MMRREGFDTLYKAPKEVNTLAVQASRAPKDDYAWEVRLGGQMDITEGMGV